MKKILAVALSLTLCTPAFADRPGGRHGSYYSGYDSLSHERRRHGGGRTAGTIAAILGGVILGAALSNSSRRRESTENVTTYVAPAPTYAAPAYVEPTYNAPNYQSSCFERQVTEPTASGRYVTYTETVCR